MKGKFSNYMWCKLYNLAQSNGNAIWIRNTWLDVPLAQQNGDLK